MASSTNQPFPNHQTPSPALRWRDELARLAEHEFSFLHLRPQDYLALWNAWGSSVSPEQALRIEVDARRR